MEIRQRTGSILERHLDDNTRADVAKLLAVMDYNIMMGTLEDPSEEEDTQDE